MANSKVQTINFKGKPYVQVAERVRLVHEQKREFEVLDSTFQEIAGRVLCKVVIMVDGKRYTGSAEAKIHNAIPKSADDTNPLECAETSALGRALAFAGLGTVDGIASYDEVARGVPTSELEESITDKLNRLYGKAKRAGKCTSLPAFLFYVSGLAGENVTAESITEQHVKLIEADLIKAA